MAKNVKKIAVSLNADLVKNLDFLSDMLGVTRSALLNDLVEVPVAQLSEAFAAYDGYPTHEEGKKRVFSSLAEIIEDRERELREIQHDLKFDS